MLICGSLHAGDSAVSRVVNVVINRLKTHSSRLGCYILINLYRMDL